MSQTTTLLISFGFGLATAVTWGMWKVLEKLDRIIALLENHKPVEKPE